MFELSSFLLGGKLFERISRRISIFIWSFHKILHFFKFNVDAAYLTWLDISDKYIFNSKNEKWVYGRLISVDA